MTNGSSSSMQPIDPAGRVAAIDVLRGLHDDDALRRDVDGEFEILSQFRNALQIGIDARPELQRRDRMTDGAHENESRIADTPCRLTC